MNDKKICFISCVNNHQEYRKSQGYIRSLIIPEGFEVETVSIEQAKSMTSGYNQAMKNSDAKYKVYIHQDVYIINPNFLNDILNLFTKYPKLGMLGVVGAKKLHDATWWRNPVRYGTVYSSHQVSMNLVAFNKVNGDYEKVQAIDGLIMVTQYDLLWREDLFHGWHFYDTSQCLEFIKAGYEVGIPKQSTPWCIHDCGFVNMRNYEENKKIFCKSYNWKA